MVTVESLLGSIGIKFGGSNNSYYYSIAKSASNYFQRYQRIGVF